MSHARVARLARPVSDRDHLAGRVDAPLTLLEYGDYESPSCAWAFPIVHEIRRRLAREVRFTFRNFPLWRVHPHAEHAAEVAEAAAAQLEFWPMHDWLFRHQHTLDDSALLDGAAELGLRVERVRRELAHGTYRARVEEDVASGIRSGVTGTPTFFLNGIRHDGELSLETLLAAIEKISASAARE